MAPAFVFTTRSWQRGQWSHVLTNSHSVSRSRESQARFPEFCISPGHRSKRCPLPGVPEPLSDLAVPSRSWDSGRVWSGQSEMPGHQGRRGAGGSVARGLLAAASGMAICCPDQPGPLASSETASQCPVGTFPSPVSPPRSAHVARWTWPHPSCGCRRPQGRKALRGAPGGVGSAAQGRVPIWPVTAAVGPSEWLGVVSGPSQWGMG